MVPPLANPLATPPDTPLAERLREGTRELHREVERSGAMAALLRGELGPAGYHAMLRNLHALYAALEEGLLRQAGHAALAPLVQPALFRRQVLEHDLATLPPPQPLPPLCAATVAYVQRLHDLAAHRPALLAAHAYVRYLGDLNGGQVLRRLLAGSALLPPGLGMRFHDFGDAARVAELVAAFRDGLARLPAAGEAGDALVDEARWAFRQHRALFLELMPPPVQAGPGG